MGIDDRVGRREDLRHPVVVRDQDVDPALDGDGDLRVARRPAVDRDDDGAAGGAGRLDRQQRQAVALVLAARHVRLGPQPGPAQGERHRREAGQPVRVEVAEDQHPFPAGPGAPDALQEPVRVGQQGRVVEPVLGRRQERVQTAHLEEPASDEHLQDPPRQPAPGAVLAQECRDDDRLREGPAMTGREHRPDGRIRRSTGTYRPRGGLPDG